MSFFHNILVSLYTIEEGKFKTKEKYNSYFEKSVTASDVTEVLNETKGRMRILVVNNKISLK